VRQFTVGTRGSALALWQTRHVRGLIEPLAGPSIERIITTQGDVNMTERLQGAIEKGFFTEELEAALRDRTIDFAVHSLKDLPTRMPKGLALGAVLKRASPGDLLIVHPEAVEERRRLPLKEGSKVGSSSLRRESLLGRYAPWCVSQPLRGNVPTRVEKLRARKYDAVLLAEAGVGRLELSLEGLLAYQLNPRRWVCAPGQGAIGVQCREDDAEVLSVLRNIDHAATRYSTEIERDFLKVLEGGCTTPFGCFVEGQKAHLGLLAPGGWHGGILDLDPEIDAAWMLDALARIRAEDSKENEDEWLFRRV
jgi:hydroxymethylbilane synthase